jgi:hypothetical protein
MVMIITTVKKCSHIRQNGIFFDAVHVDPVVKPGKRINGFIGRSDREICDFTASPACQLGRENSGQDHDDGGAVGALERVDPCAKAAQTERPSHMGG